MQSEFLKDPQTVGSRIDWKEQGGLCGASHQVKPLQASRETDCSLYQVEVSEKIERGEWT